MLQLLRKLRRKMITEKQLGNYLAYAVGEIILIVIGILIALAINNSNQQRIIREKEQVYLQGLRDEFGTSKLKLEELIKVNRANYLGAKKLVAFMTDKETPPDEQTLSALLYNTFAFDIAFNPNNSLLNEMISSGSSKDISNPELRIRLTNWISTMEDISRQEADLDLQREKVLDIFRSDQYSIKTTLDQTETVSKEIGLPKSENPASNLGLLDSKEFENNVIMFIITSYYTETNHYTPLMQELEYILELINEEVEE